MQNKDISSTFLKGLVVLRAFEDQNTGRTLADLSKATGHDRATVRRMALTLVEAGFMIQTDRHFHLSTRILTLAGAVLRSNEIGVSVQPILNEHAEDLGREITLALREGPRALLLAQSTSAAGRVSLGLTVGSTLPLLPTAIGRMLLARLADDDIGKHVAHLPNVAHTPATQQDLGDLKSEIQAARQGHARVNGEYEPGICALAVPVGSGASVVGTTLPMATPDLGQACDTAIAALQATAARLNTLTSVKTWG